MWATAEKTKQPHAYHGEKALAMNPLPIVLTNRSRRDSAFLQEANMSNKITTKDICYKAELTEIGQTTLLVANVANKA